MFLNILRETYDKKNHQRFFLKRIFGHLSDDQKYMKKKQFHQNWNKFFPLEITQQNNELKTSNLLYLLVYPRGGGKLLKYLLQVFESTYEHMYGTKWIPRPTHPMKDVLGCDKPREAAKKRYTRGFLNGGTHYRNPVVSV